MKVDLIFNAFVALILFAILCWGCNCATHNYYRKKRLGVADLMNKGNTVFDTLTFIFLLFFSTIFGVLPSMELTRIILGIARVASPSKAIILLIVIYSMLTLVLMNFTSMGRKKAQSE